MNYREAIEVIQGQIRDLINFSDPIDPDRLSALSRALGTLEGTINALLLTAPTEIQDRVSIAQSTTQHSPVMGSEQWEIDEVKYPPLFPAKSKKGKK